MKFAAALLAATASATSASTRVKFVEHINNYNKSFLTMEEFEARHELFAITDKIIEEHNATESSFTLGHNKFSDMTEEEKKSYRGLLRTEKTRGETKPIIRDDPLPESIDWRTKGGVNPIQNQGNCGSCWAFSAIAGLEGAYFVSSGNLIKISEQQIVDCAGLQY